MKSDNPFDRRLTNSARMPLGLREAAVDLTDTLDLCWAAAQAVFEDKAVPAHAFELLPMFIERAAWQRQQLRAQATGGTADESPPLPALSARPLA